MTCVGNPSEHCGAQNRLIVYNYVASLLVGSTDHTAGNMNVVSLVKRGLPGSWAYAACYVDNANGRVLGNEQDNSAMTVESCISYCSASNFTLAAIEYGVQCCE